MLKKRPHLLNCWLRTWWDRMSQWLQRENSMKIESCQSFWHIIGFPKYQSFVTMKKFKSFNWKRFNSSIISDWDIDGRNQKSDRDEEFELDYGNESTIKALSGIFGQLVLYCQKIDLWLIKYSFRSSNLSIKTLILEKNALIIMGKYESEYRENSILFAQSRNSGTQDSDARESIPILLLQLFTKSWKLSIERFPDGINFVLLVKHELEY